MILMIARRKQWELPDVGAFVHFVAASLAGQQANYIADYLDARVAYSITRCDQASPRATTLIRKARVQSSDSWNGRLQFGS